MTLRAYEPLREKIPQDFNIPSDLGVFCEGHLIWFAIIKFIIRCSNMFVIKFVFPAIRERYIKLCRSPTTKMSMSLVARVSRVYLDFSPVPRRRPNM